MTQRFLRRREVESITGLPRSSLYDLMKAGRFPRPVPLNDEGHAVAWVESEISEWQEERIAERETAS